ncbi:MAG: efflux RND transporter periplasmic adaptor subunit [Simkania negevensis]|nr:efflux RND transporter periplasmic adaptor subunit [Simkania negevensis]
MKHLSRQYLFLLFLISLIGCTKKQEVKKVKPIPVKVAEAIFKNVPEFIETVGHMEAYKIVNIMAEADGLLLHTYFEDGANVKKGDLLYMIDQRPYIASLKQAEAVFEESIASASYAKRTAERNAKLVVDDYISKESFDNLMTNAYVDDAVVKQNEAAVEIAKINLSYTTIYAPLNARAGQSLVRDGNLILQAAETKLVTLNQITPIYATFFIPEKDLSKVQRKAKESSGLKIKIFVEDPTAPPYEGILTFIDNQVDLATGMIEMKATFANEEEELWPNQYVRVQLILDEIKNAVLLPSEAIQVSPQGKYVYIVTENNEVVMQPVKVGQREGNQIIISEGLKGGEIVVTEGQLNIYPGIKITPVLNKGTQ